ncbi:MAG: RNA polymerase sigma factor [Myxococcaceae bacterium]|nr:RNA polymerase sigma factor [Myxococcaceae bacterium]
MSTTPHLRLAGPPAVTVDDFYGRYARYVARLGFRLLGRDDGLDDLVQDVFLAAAAARVVSKSEHELRGWLATVTVRLAGRVLRRRRLARFFGLDEGPDERLLSSGAAPDTVAMMAQLYRRLDAAPTAERLAWTLRYVENEPLDEVARLCGCSLATAKRRIAAVQRLLTEDDDDA